MPTKVHLVKAMVCPVVMYEYESWTVKKAEHRRIDAFELWCSRRLLRVPWTARRSNQSILKEISPGISLEGMMLKLKLQYFGHLMWRVDSLEKTLMLGEIGGRRRRGRQRVRWLDGITDSMDVSLGELWELVMDWHTMIHGIEKSQTWLSDWTELKNSDSIQNHILLFTAQASQRRYLWWVGERFFAGLFYYLLIDDISWPLTQGHGDHLQYYCLENPMDRGAWWATVQEVAKSQTQLKRLTWHMHARPF